MASSAEPTATIKKEEEPEEESTETSAGAGDDEDTGAQVAPIVKLHEVSVTTGEEDEDVLLDLKAKLYRFDKDGNQWKERGVGTVKLLKHKETNKVRLVMRQSKTLKICANHLVVPSISIQEHTGSDKSCVWHAADYADGELKEELFCIRFASVENCKTFKEKFEEIVESQGKKTLETEEVSSPTKQLEKLSLDKSQDDGKTKEAPVSAEKKDGNVEKENSGSDE